MSNEDDTVWIVFNGEIYNFQALREELKKLGHTFRSNADTEVIIHAYEEWGDAHVHRLRGMFAYAIYDRRPKMTGGIANTSTKYRLLLVRDRLGIKPLFYYWDGCTFLFASEIKAILAYPGVNRSIDRSGIFDYLTYLYIPTPKTAYTHIRKLAPGHLLVFECAVQDLLPEPILSRPKKGFSAPWTTWINTKQEWATCKLRSGDDHQRLLREDITEMPCLFNRGSKVWTLLILKEWLLSESGINT